MPGAEEYKRVKAIKDSRGECDNCTAPRMLDRKLCASHVEKQRLYNKRYRAQRGAELNEKRRTLRQTQKDKGFCTSGWCMSPVTEGSALCADHYTVIHNRKADRQGQGLCVSCAQPAVGKTDLCQKHTANKINAKKRVENEQETKGLCQRNKCSVTALPDLKYCAEHQLACAEWSLDYRTSGRFADGMFHKRHDEQAKSEAENAVKENNKEAAGGVQAANGGVPASYNTGGTDGGESKGAQAAKNKGTQKRKRVGESGEPAGKKNKDEVFQGGSAAAARENKAAERKIEEPPITVVDENGDLHFPPLVPLVLPPVSRPRRAPELPVLDYAGAVGNHAQMAAGSAVRMLVGEGAGAFQGSEGREIIRQVLHGAPYIMGTHPSDRVGYSWVDNRMTGAAGDAGLLDEWAAFKLGEYLDGLNE